MTKKIFSLDYINYQFSKLKKKSYIIATKAVTFIYKKKIPLELLSIMEKNNEWHHKIVTKKIFNTLIKEL